MQSKEKVARLRVNGARSAESRLALLPEGNGNGIVTKLSRTARLPDERDGERSAERAAANERRALERFLKRMECTADEWEKRRRHYLEKPQSDEELNSNTWKAAKIRHSGAAVEVALRRQKTLAPDLWMIAFLMAQGYNRTNIPGIIHLKQRRVDMLIADLKGIVIVDFGTDTDAAVARWFFGHPAPRS